MASGPVSLKKFDDVPIANEAVVGDSIDCTVFSQSQTTTLTRKPGGSSATVSSNAFTVDVPGLYVVTITWSEGQSVVRNFVAFPASVLTRKLRNGRKIDRPLLRALCNTSRITSGAGLQANVSGSLESPGAGSADGVDGRLFGMSIVGSAIPPLDVDTYGEGTG